MEAGGVYKLLSNKVAQTYTECIIFRTVKYVHLIPKHYDAVMNDEMHRVQDSTNRPMMQSRSLCALVLFRFGC